jgi:hypothetical protein
MKLAAKIHRNNKGGDGIEYLVIESDELDTKGFFLFFHCSLNSPSEADLWFPDIEGAKSQAALNYGINDEDWELIE